MLFYYFYEDIITDISSYNLYHGVLKEPNCNMYEMSILHFKNLGITSKMIFKDVIKSYQY